MAWKQLLGSLQGFMLVSREDRRHCDALWQDRALQEKLAAVAAVYAAGA
jgi:hypothetical protein